MIATDDSERGSSATSASGFLGSASGPDRPLTGVVEDPANLVGKLGAAVIALIIASGIAGNLLVIVVVVKNRRLRRSYNVLIASLSATDLAFAVLVMPFYADSYASRRWRHSIGLCLFETYFGTTAIVSTGLHIALIAANRCCLVACPRRYPALASRPAVLAQIGVAWTAALAVVLPGAAFGWNAVVEYSDQVGRCNYVRSASRLTLYLVFGAGFVGPCTVMLCCYVVIWNVARKSRQRVTKRVRRVDPTPAARSSSSELVAGAVQSVATNVPDVCQSLVIVEIAPTTSSEVAQPTTSYHRLEGHDSIGELPASIPQFRVLPENDTFTKPDFRLDQDFRDLKPFTVVRETESLDVCPIPLENLYEAQFQVSSSSEKDCLIYPRSDQFAGPQDLPIFLAISKENVSSVKTGPVVESSSSESDLSHVAAQALKLHSRSGSFLPEASLASPCNQTILFNNQTLDQEPLLTPTRKLDDYHLQVDNNAAVGLFGGSNTMKPIQSSPEIVIGIGPELPIIQISSGSADFQVLEKEVEKKDLRYEVGIQGQTESDLQTTGSAGEEDISPDSSTEIKASILKRNISSDLRSSSSRRIAECPAPSALRSAYLEAEHAKTSKEHLRCHQLLLKPGETSTPDNSNSKRELPEKEKSRGSVAVSMTSESIKRDVSSVVAAAAAAPKRKTDYRSVRMILVVFVAFALTYLPFTLINLADQRSELHRNWYMVTSLGFWAGSSVNPVIYGITNRQFRAAYRSMIVDGCRK